MAFKNEAGLGVSNFYGPRVTCAPKGGINTLGSIQEFTVDIWGGSFAEGDDIYNNVFLPEGALMVDAYAYVSEAFDLGGTDPAISIGTAGSEATNGVTLDETALEAVGVKKLDTFNGTWSQALADATEVSYALGGTSPTIDASKGKVRVTVRYVKLGVSPNAAAGSKGQGSESA